jgi:glucose-6-phosphate isomerase
MELPDEAISYTCQGLLVPAGEEWTPAAELRVRHFLSPARLKESAQRIMTCKSQVAAERGIAEPPAEQLPLEPGFIDLPQNLLDAHRRKGDASELGQTLALATSLRDEADRIVILGTGGAALGVKALFAALKPVYHNELPAETRLGVPRFYFDGDQTDNDGLQDLLDLLQVTCVDPEERAERWAVIVLDRSGDTLEPAVALRVFRREGQEYYGLRSPWLKKLFAAATGSKSRLRSQLKAQGLADDQVLPIPGNVGGRFSVFSPAGLLPVALMGLDVRALLLGAATMTKRFLEEPFERNPVLQFVAVNHLMTAELGKPLRILAVWSRKLEALGKWYEHLVAETLGKQGGGPTPIALVGGRDVPTHMQLLQEGPRDRVVTNLVVKNPKAVPILVQMSDQNEDDLNALCRKGLPDLAAATLRGLNRALFETARPSSDLVLPTLSEHTLGQLLQMLMLATVVEGRLLGLNPYSSPGSEAFKRQVREALKG